MLSPLMMSVLVSFLEWEYSPDYESKTLQALERRGLIKWYPYGKRDGFTGIWKLTANGKEVAKHLAQSQSAA